LESELAKQKEDNARRITAVEESRFKCNDPDAKWAVLQRLRKRMTDKAQELNQQQTQLSEVRACLIA
jgi:hypothetical protein